MTTYSTINRNQQSPLSNTDLMRLAPSIFATEAYGEMSDRYTFIPTIQVVDKLRNEGFQPFSAIQSRTRIQGKAGFTKHVIRFRDTRNGNAPATRHLGQIYPEVILTNSHDGGSTYNLEAGLFRLVCLNGMTVSEGGMDMMKVRHTGTSDGIIEASYSIVDQFPRVLDSVERFQSLALTSGQQNAFATAALELRYDEKAPVTPEQILKPKRRDDAGSNLWNTFNVVQEHLTQGGARGYDVATARRVKVRAVNGIGENSRLNRALWTLADKMRELVG